LEFLVEKLYALGPVDLGVDGGEQQRQELGEVLLQGLFPRAIVVVLDGGVRGCSVNCPWNSNSSMLLVTIVKPRASAVAPIKAS